MIFLLLPIDTAFFITFISHSIFAGIFSFLMSREFKLTYTASIFIAALFITSPNLAAFLEAGHYGLIISFYWIPFLTFSIFKLIKTPKFLWAISLAFASSAIYFNHVLTALIVAAGATLSGFVLILTRIPNLKKILKFATVSVVLIFSALGLPLYYQLSWQGQTTRDLLLKNPDVYPKWSSKLEFLSYALAPWAGLGPKDLETEKIITVGTLPALLAFFGFWKLKKRYRILITVFAILVVLISLNNASFFYDFLLKQNWYVLLRVSTRLFILLLVPTLLLAGRGLDFLLTRNKKLANFLLFLAVGETTLLSYFIISKPITVSPNKAPQEVYLFLSRDKDIFRVFCTTRCLSQKAAAIYKLHLAEGYGTLQQKNYFNAAMQIGQYYWDKYTLSIPPIEIYSFTRLQPHAPTLAIYEIKYVVSPHKLTDKNLKLVKNVDNFSIYKNTLFKKTNYLIYTPNFIRVETSGKNGSITIPLIFNQLWSAFDDSNKELEISETSDRTIEFKLKKESRFVDLKFPSF